MVDQVAIDFGELLKKPASGGDGSGSSGSTEGGARPDAYKARELPVEKQQQNFVELQQYKPTDREIAEDRAEKIAVAMQLTPEQKANFVTEVGNKTAAVGISALNDDEMRNSLQKTTGLPPFLIDAKLAMTGAREAGLLGGDQITFRTGDQFVPTALSIAAPERSGAERDMA